MLSPLLIDQVADTTAYRDRDALDRSIAGLLIRCWMRGWCLCIA